MIKQLQELHDKVSFLTENGNLGDTKNLYTTYHFQKYTESLDSINKLGTILHRYEYETKNKQAEKRYLKGNSSDF